jgi:hypothetical protein
VHRRRAGLHEQAAGVTDDALFVTACQGYLGDSAFCNATNGAGTGTNDACDAICDNATTKPDWCPGRLSMSAVVEIIIACIIIVAAVAFAVWYFLVRGKDSRSYSPEILPP